MKSARGGALSSDGTVPDSRTNLLLAQYATCQAPLPLNLPTWLLQQCRKAAPVVVAILLEVGEREDEERVESFGIDFARAAVDARPDLEGRRP